MTRESVVQRLGIVMLVVSDLERSVGFYRDLLGLELKYLSAHWAEFDAGSVDLALHLAGDGVTVGAHGWCSMAFYVDDAAHSVAQLRARGVTVVHAASAERFGGVLGVVDDPDGYRIQLLELGDLQASG